MAAEQRRSGASFKETVNQALRKGLVEESPAAPRKRFQVKPIHAGLNEIWKSDSVAELLETLEGPDHR